MAIALGQKLAILAADDAELERHSTVSIDACSLPEQITTLCWIAYANFNEGTTPTVFFGACLVAVCASVPRYRPQSASSCRQRSCLHAGEQRLLQDVCLLLGTSLGYLQLHAEDGQLLHRQRLHTTSAQTLSARVSGMGKLVHNHLCCLCSVAQSLLVAVAGNSCLLLCAGLKPDDGAEDVSMTFRDSIVKITALEIRSLVRKQLQIRRWDDDSTASPLSYNIWDLRKAGPRSAGIVAGLNPPSLYGSLTGRETQPKLLLLTAGRYFSSSC